MAAFEKTGSRWARIAVGFDRRWRSVRKRRVPLGRVLGGLCLVAVAILAIRAWRVRRCQAEGPGPGRREPEEDRLKYVLHGDRVDSGYLRHVTAVLERLGLRRVSNSTEFDLLWSHVYPFGQLAPFAKSFLQNLRPHQKVNHFPGSGFFTNKVDLATSDLKFVPKAFHLPSQKEELLNHAKKNPGLLFVQKSNSHRGIKVLPVVGMNLDAPGTFVQEFVQKPLLIDGLKFDIGLYTVLTSVDPLRVYVYNGDVLLRFCSKKYEPFDPEDVDKYVVGDDYIPIWEVPSLKRTYTQGKFSMKETLNVYLRNSGKNPAKIWSQIESSIANVFLEKEAKIVGITKRYRNEGNFFEMVRFDYILDAELNIYLMEVNMSPNLSSEHFPPNRLLYENVLFCLFALVGVGKRTKSFAPRSAAEEEMEAGERGLTVWGEECLGRGCAACGGPECSTCRHCLTGRSLRVLRQAYLEHMNRMDYKRVFPPKMNPKWKADDVDLEQYSPENRFMFLWFLGKCRQDSSWC